MNRPNSINGQHDEEKAYRLLYLVSGFIRQTISYQEQAELDTWIDTTPANFQLFAELTDEQRQARNVEELQSIDTEKALQRIRLKIGFNPPQKKSVKKIIPWMIAASLVLIAGIIGYLQFSNKADNAVPDTAENQSLPPGGNIAILHLSDGSLLNLDTIGSGQISQENGLNVIKTKEAELLYTGNPGKIASALYNRLSTPRGGQYQLRLPDGTRVWLNAASSLKYPLQFPGKERLVELTGEAYFEVAADPSKKFKILLPGQQIVEALGTNFNINSYRDDGGGIHTTLLKGSVQITDADCKEPLVLKTGEQAISKDGHVLRSTAAIDTAEVMAWKNGFFYFRNASLDIIMRQIERWYDVEIRFEKPIHYHFNGRISRNVQASRVLELLEKTNQVRFIIEGKKIIVEP